MKKTNLFKALSAVFFAIGLIFIILGVIMFHTASAFVHESEAVTAEISSISTEIESNGETSYTAFVTYTYAGETHKNVRLDEYSSTMYEGKSIELYVDKDNPENVRVKSMVYLLPIIFTGIGVIFCVICIVFIIINAKIKNRVKMLKKTGIKIQAQITSGHIDTAYTKSGKHPYRLECVYYDERSGQPVICTSDIVWDSPDLYVGKSVCIYADSDDKSKYVVDLDSLDLKSEA